jgi:hypothetical protein
MPNHAPITLLESIKLFVLPPLATLAVLGISAMTYMNHASRRSLPKTYVVAGLKQNNPCALCHAGTFQRIHLRVTSVR